MPARSSGPRGAAIQPRKTHLHALLGIAIAGVLFRLLLVAATPAWSVTVDGARFRQLAASGMKGTAFIPPLYPFFLRLISNMAGEGIAPVRIAQSLMGGLTILLTGILAGRLSQEATCRRASIAAASLAAFAPPTVLADLTVMSESLAAFLIAVFLAAAGRPGDPGWPLRAVASGLSLGLGALCRAPLFLYALIRGVTVFLKAGGEARLRRGAVVSTLAALVAIAPWTARNYALFGRFVPVSTNGGYNFWKAFNKDSNGTHNRNFDLSIFTPVEEKDLDAVGYGEGLRFIREHPLKSAALAPLKEGYLWGLERQFCIGLRDGVWGPIPHQMSVFLLLAIPATQLFWVFFAPLGLLAAPRSPTRCEGLLLLAFTTGLHLVYHGEARYHTPLLPLLLAAASVGACSSSSVREGPARTPRFLIPVLIAALVVSFWCFELLSGWEQLRAAMGR